MWSDAAYQRLVTLLHYVGAVPFQSRARLPIAAKLVAGDPELNELLGEAAYGDREGRAAYHEAQGVLRARGAEASGLDLLDLVTEMGRQAQLPGASFGTR